MKVRSVVAVLTASLLLAAAPTARATTASGEAAWRQARFGPGHLGTNPFEAVLSPTTAGGLHQLWATQLGDDVGMSSPAVVDGVLYIGAWDTRVYALDVQTGTILWSTPTDGVEESSPAVGHGLVYTHSDAGTLYALDAATGHVAWSAHPGHAVGSPVIAGGSVFVNGYSQLDAYDAISGQVEWTAPSGLAVNAPTVAHGHAFVVDEDGNVTAFDEGDGTEVWTRNLDASFQLSTPAVSRRSLYVGSVNEYPQAVYQISSRTGRRGWTTRFPGAMDSSPAIADGMLYITGQDNARSTATLYALDARSGAELWSQDVGGFASVFGPGPSVANGVVYVVSDTAYAIDGSTGTILWSQPIDSTPRGTSSPVVVNGTLYVGGGDTVYAFGL